MGRKYLEVLTAKMMLGIRKKVHQPRQNQKAFWNWVQVQSQEPWLPLLSHGKASKAEVSQLSTHPGSSQHVTDNHTAVVQSPRQGLAGGNVLSHLRGQRNTWQVYEEVWRTLRHSAHTERFFQDTVGPRHL